MALPRLNKHIHYTTKVPSTGQEIKFRPYLVSEEKLLLMALEHQDKPAVLHAIGDTLRACISEDTPVDVLKLPIFDIEYLFTQIRSKSVGESADITLECGHVHEDGRACGHVNEVSVDLAKVKVNVPKGRNANKIVIQKDPDEIVLEMKYPDFSDAVSGIAKYGEDDSKVEMMFDQFEACIEAVQVGSDRIVLADETPEERSAFVQSLNTKQMTQVREWIEKIPALTHKVSFVCESCGSKNEKNLTGTQDFF